MSNTETLTVFAAASVCARGTRESIKAVLQQMAAADDRRPVLMFEDHSGRQIDFDWRAEPTEDKPPAEEAPRRRGRPRLGVKGREVTLLPRHWEWLDSQRGGASAALRRLVDEARKNRAPQDEQLAAQSRCNHFMTAMAGDLMGYEDATRALFSADREAFEHCLEHWPADIKRYAMELATGAFA